MDMRKGICGFDSHPTLSTRLASLPDSDYESNPHGMEGIIQELSSEEEYAENVNEFCGALK